MPTKYLKYIWITLKHGHRSIKKYPNILKPSRRSVIEKLIHFMAYCTYCIHKYSKFLKFGGIEIVAGHSNNFRSSSI